jgi:hypothetical protein
MTIRKIIPFITALIATFIFYLIMDSLKIREDFKYKILIESNIYRTNSFKKDSNGCIEFFNYNKKIIVCGNYSIIENK